MLSYRVYRIPGIEPRTLCILSKQSINWTQTHPSLVIFNSIQTHTTAWTDRTSHFQAHWIPAELSSGQPQIAFNRPLLCCLPRWCPMVPLGLQFCLDSNFDSPVPPSHHIPQNYCNKMSPGCWLNNSTYPFKIPNWNQGVWWASPLPPGRTCFPALPHLQLYPPVLGS